MRKIKVLLVDDNHLALEYLEGIIEWEDYGFTVAGCAIDGADALAKYKELHPKLVITDISMPVMSGISLSEEIRKIHKNTRIIFLSSYDEFDYVRSALKLQVSDYILKHELDRESLGERLIKVREEMQEQEAGQILWRENLLHDFFMVHSEPEVPFFRDRYSCIAVRWDMPLEPFYQEKVDIVLEKQFQSACYELADSVFGVCYVGDFTRLIFLKEQVRRSGARYYEWKTQLEQVLGSSCTFIVMLCDGDLYQQRVYFESHRRVLRNQYFANGSMVLYSEWMQAEEKPPACVCDRERVLYMIAAGEANQLQAYLDGLFWDILEKEDEESLICSSEILLEILKKYEGKLKNVQTGELFEMERDHQKWFRAKHIMQWMKETYQHLMQILNDNRNVRYTRYTKQAIDFIYSHYANQNLGVEDIAGQIGVGGNYLNQVFREEMHTTLHRFLAEYRIEKAKELLREGKVKIGEIPEAVGYANSQYFSKVFKKETGMTPFEYRQRN